MKSTFGPWAGALGVVAVGAAGVVVWQTMETEAQTPLDETAAVSVPALNAVTPSKGQSAPISEQSSEPADTLAAKTLAPPSIDVVRVDPTGNALVAGLVLPGEDVSVLIDGVEVTRVAGQSDGSFVAMLDIAPSAVPRVLSLRAEGEAERLSDSSILIAPSPQKLAQQAAVQKDSGPDSAAPAPAPSVATAAPITASRLGAGSDAPEKLVQQAAVQTDSGPDSAAPAPAPSVAAAAPVTASRLGAGSNAQALAPDTETPLVPLDAKLPPALDDAPAPVPVQADPVEQPETAPAVLMATANTVRLLQPSGEANARPSSVVVDAISYNPTGDVVLSGRGGADPAETASQVRIYLDNAPVQTAEIAADGTWSLPLSDVKSGVYTLRVDQIDGEGQVASRFETPFKRESTAVLARVAGQKSTDPALSITAVTVQPGFTLWGIASDRYGDGLKYVQVFNANKGLIKDPNLIYPGQVFALPTD